MKLNVVGMLGGTGIVVAALMSAQISCGSARPEPPPPPNTEALARQVVSAIYERLSTYSGGPDDGLAFQLSDFRTLERPEFGNIKVAELATLEGGDIIDMTALRYEVGGHPVAYYRSSWGSGKSTQTPEELLQMDTLSMAELLEQEGARHPLFKDVQALTTFSVEVRLAGRSRSYRAAFLWHQLSAEIENGASGTAVDQITMGVSDVIREASAPPQRDTMPPIGSALGTTAAALTSAEASTAAGGPICEAWTSVEPYPLVVPDANGYDLDLGVDIVCKCDERCTSVCSPIIRNTKCVRTAGCRALPQMEIAPKPSIAGDAHKEPPASCAVALGCTGRACPKLWFFCAGCSVKITVRGVFKTNDPDAGGTGEFGIEVSWPSDISAKDGLLVGGIAESARCPRCYEVGQTGSHAIEVKVSTRTDRLDDVVVTEPGCGNDVCELSESCQSCPTDCGSCADPVTVCGNDICEPGESCQNCSVDCACGGGGGGGGCQRSRPTDKPTASGPTGCFNDTHPTFSWSAVEGATDYAVKVFDVTNSGEQLIYFNSTVNTTLSLPFALSAERSYRWAVKGMNCGGFGPYSEAQYFTVASMCIAPATAPVLAGPQGCVDATRPTFTWNPVPGATRYRIVVSTTDRDNFFIDQVVSGTSFTSPVALEPKIQFRFRVRAINDTGPGPMAESMYFTPFCGGVASLITAPLGCIDTATPVFTWMKVPAAVQYWLLVANSPDFSNPATTVLVDRHLAVTSLAPGVTFARGQTYYAKVKTILDPSSTTAAAWSPTVSFSVLCPALAKPTDLKATVVDGSVSLTWTPIPGATGYNVKRATTSGGPYTAIATGLSLPTHSDRAVKPGLTYYYVVSFTTPWAESANSTEAAATINNREPFGYLDVVEPAVGGLRVMGWALDPDASASIAVHVYVNGTFAGAGPADLSRPDVDAAFHMGANRGFNVVVPAAAAGTVCVYAIDTQGGTNPLLACRPISSSAPPYGSLDVAARGPSGIHVSGWALDPDTTNPTQIHVYVDGVFATAAIADLSRPDVDAAFHLGANHGFDLNLPNQASGGVCVYAINVGAGSNALIRCQFIPPSMAADPHTEDPTMWIGDYDGDHHADIGVYRHPTAQWFIHSSDATLQSLAWGAAIYNDMAVPADYDGDGKTDIAVYRQATGEWFARRSTDVALTQVAWGAPSLDDVPVPRDFDGDGKTDIAVYRRSTAEWFVRRSSDLGVMQVAWGAPTLDDVAVPRDYDGDGKADIAVYRRSTAEWFVRRSSDLGVTQVAWGAPTLDDVAIPADYDGDGRADIAVYRRSTGDWYIRNSGNLTLRQVSWGAPSHDDVAVPADYDGDGKADIAVYRRSTGDWYVLRSTDAGNFAVQW